MLLGRMVCGHLSTTMVPPLSGSNLVSYIIGVTVLEACKSLSSRFSILNASKQSVSLSRSLILMMAASMSVVSSLNTTAND